MKRYVCVGMMKRGGPLYVDGWRKSKDGTRFFYWEDGELRYCAWTGTTANLESARRRWQRDVECAIQSAKHDGNSEKLHALKALKFNVIKEMEVGP